MRRIRLTPIIALLLIAGLAVSIVKLWRYSPYKVTRDLVGNPQVVLSLHNVQVVGRGEGVRIWSFKADDVDVSRGRMRTVIRGVHEGKLFDKGKLVADVTAGEAVYDAANKNVEVTRGAKVTAKLGFKASTDRLMWSGSNRQLLCPGRVVFSSGDGKLVGQNLLADVGRGEVTLWKGKMQVEIEDVRKLEEGTPKKPAPGNKQ
jgi:hypothetical protein